MPKNRRRPVAVGGRRESALDIVSVPEYREVVELFTGKLALAEGVVYVFPTRPRSPWGPLSPLVEYSETQEVFVRGKSARAVVASRDCRVEVPGLNAARLAANLAIMSDARLDWSHPFAEVEVEDPSGRTWRVYLKSPMVARAWEVHAARLARQFELAQLVDPLLAARLLLAVVNPCVVVIAGSPGSGKTTLLNAILREISSLWPHLRISVVEQVYELDLPEGAYVARSKAYGAASVDVTTLLRQAMRHERVDVIVLGELRGEEVVSWFEAKGTGVGALATIHAPSAREAVERMAALMRAAGYEGSPREVLGVVDLIVFCKKYKRIGEVVERGVECAYASDGRSRLVPIYIDGVHAPDDAFLGLLPWRLRLGSMVGRREEVYELLKERFGAGREPVMPDICRETLEFAKSL